MVRRRTLPHPERPWWAGVALSALLTACAAPAADSVPLHQRLSPADVALADRTVQQALETTRSGIALAWRNDATGSAGSVTPLRTYRSAAGLFCRDYREALTVAGTSELYRETACRDGDGLWKVVR